MVRVRFSPDVCSRVGDAKVNRLALVFSLLIVLIPVATLNAQSSIEPFLGRWDLTIKTPKQELPSWIDISEEQGQPKVIMVGLTDHATPLARVQMKEGQIEFVSPKGEEGFSEDMEFKGTVVGGQLVGTTTGSSGASWPWIGRRAPAMKRTGTPKWGNPIPLFNGKDFTGWRFSDPSRAGNWKVEGGDLVNHGHGSEIISTSKFEDFKLHLEFNCGPRSNSGVYLRGRYEVQIETDSVQEPPSHHTGGVYGFLAPTPELPRKPGEWQTFDITLVGRTVTIVQNGQTVIDNQEIPGITGGALDSHEELPGPIYLQGSEEGRVAFRNIVVVPAEK
jgi:3-keto-disaccharide hydrolase